MDGIHQHIYVVVLDVSSTVVQQSVLLVLVHYRSIVVVSVPGIVNIF